MSNVDRLRASLREIIDAATRGTRFHRLVRARVVNVHDGGKVDTMPESIGTPPLTELPLRYGLPGVLRAVAKAGGRALVGWADGDPAQPYVAAWDPGELEELVFDVSGGAEHLSRTGDTVDCGTLIVSPSGSVVTYVAPGGVAPPLGLNTGYSITGTITGTSRVKA